MPRITAPVGVFALAALLSGTALAGEPANVPAAATLLQSVDANIRDAQLMRTQKDYAGAVKVLSQLMLVAPDDARVVGEYGKVLVQQGRAREALDFLTRAVQLQPGDWTLFSALGVAYDQTGDYVKARGAYERALSLKPGETVVLNNYAMSRVLAGDPREAKLLIARAAAGSKDERIARNLKLIDGLPAPAVASVAPPVRQIPATVPAKAPASTNVAQQPPRVLTTPSLASSATVMVQPLPPDPKAGKVAKKTAQKPATAPVATANSKRPADKGIPALRLANDRP